MAFWNSTIERIRSTPVLSHAYRAGQTVGAHFRPAYREAKQRIEHSITEAEFTQSTRRRDRAQARAEKLQRVEPSEIKKYHSDLQTQLTGTHQPIIKTKTSTELAITTQPRQPVLSSIIHGVSQRPQLSRQQFEGPFPKVEQPPTGSPHLTQPTILIHGRTPEKYGEDVHIRRDPSFKEIESGVSEKIPTFESVVSSRMEFEEKHPVAKSVLTGIRETGTATPRRKAVTDVITSFGEGIYREVQEKPVQMVGWGVVGAATTPVLGAVAPAARFMPYGAHIVRGASAIGKVPYVGFAARKLPAATIYGAFGAMEYKQVTQQVPSGEHEWTLEGDTMVGTPIMRDPTYPEMAGRIGRTTATAGAMFAGAGVYKYGGVVGSKIKSVFRTKPQTAAEVAEESKRLYTVVKGFKTTEKTQPYTDTDGIMQRHTEIITEDVAESAISAAQRRRYDTVVKYQEARDLLTKSQFTTTTAAGEIKTVEQIGKTTLIKKSPGPDDIASGVEQMTFPIGISKTGTAPVKARYSGVGKDVFKKGSSDWDIIVTDPDKFTRWERVKGIGDAPFKTQTELKHVRGRVLGPIDDIKPVESNIYTAKVRTPAVAPTQYDQYGKVVKPKYDLLEGRPLATRDYEIRVRQTDVEDFFRAKVAQRPLTGQERVFGHGRKESAVELTGRSLKAVETAKPIHHEVATKPRDIDKSMKGFYVKRTEPPYGGAGKGTDVGATGRTDQPVAALVEDVATKPKSRGITAEQIVDVTEPKVVEKTYTATMSQKVVPRIIHKEGVGLIAPSLHFADSITGVQPVQELEYQQMFAQQQQEQLQFAPTTRQIYAQKPITATIQLHEPVTTHKPIFDVVQIHEPVTTHKPIFDVVQIHEPVTTHKQIYDVIQKPVVDTPLKHTPASKLIPSIKPPIMFSPFTGIPETKEERKQDYPLTKTKKKGFHPWFPASLEYANVEESMTGKRAVHIRGRETTQKLFKGLIASGRGILTKSQYARSKKL